MAIKMVTFKTNCRYLGSAHITSTVKYICQSDQCIVMVTKNLKIITKNHYNLEQPMNHRFNKL